MKTRKLFVLLFIIAGLSVSGQEKTIEKPEYIIVAGDQIISQDQVNTYGAQGLIKGMHKGVSAEVRDELAQKFGNRVGDPQFIILIDLYSPAEMDSIQRASDNSVSSNVTEEPKKDDFILHVNDQATNFEVQMTSGETIALSELKGKVVLLDFWATWCAPCILEFYDIHNRILTPMKDSNLVFLPVSIGEDLTKVQKKLAALNEKGLHLNSGADPDKTIWDSYAVGSIPKTFLIDKKGIIRLTTVGNTEDNIDNIKSTILKLLKE